MSIEEYKKSKGQIAEASELAKFFSQDAEIMADYKREYQKIQSKSEEEIEKEIDEFDKKIAKIRNAQGLHAEIRSRN